MRGSCSSWALNPLNPIQIDVSADMNSGFVNWLNSFSYNAWNLSPTVDENAISCHLSSDILTYLYLADKSSSLRMLTSFIVMKCSPWLRGSKEGQSTNRYDSIFYFVFTHDLQLVQIETSIPDGCTQMFAVTCFPETSLFSVPVIRLLQLSADLIKTLKQPLNQRVVLKQNYDVYLLIYLMIEGQTQVHLY